MKRFSGKKLDLFEDGDEFTGDLIDDRYTLANVGTGSDPAVESTATEGGGLCELSTGATTGGSSTLSLGRKQFKCDLLTIIKGRLKISDVSECDAYFGLYDDADEYVYLHINNGDIYYGSDDGGSEGPESTDTAENLADDTFVDLEIHLLATETALYYVNGKLVATGTTGAVTADFMDLYVYIVCTSNNDCNLFLDYWKIKQIRST